MYRKTLIINLLMLVQLFVQAQIPAGYHKIWDKCIGGVMPDGIHKVEKSSDGNIFISGNVSWGGGIETYCKTYGGIHHPGGEWLVKTDTSGNVLWQRSICGKGTIHDMAPSSDGGCILYCHVEAPDDTVEDKQCKLGCLPVPIWSLWLIKIDKNGNKVWDVCQGALSFTNVGNITATWDGGFFITALTLMDSSCTKHVQILPGQNTEIWEMKFDSMGNKQWENSILVDAPNWPSDVIQTRDRGYLIGITFKDVMFPSQYIAYHSKGEYDYLVIKTDSLGNKEWVAGFGGYDRESLNEVAQLDNGNYLLAGMTGNYTNGPYDGDITPVPQCNGAWSQCLDIWIVAIDSVGNKLWDHAFGGDGEEHGIWVYGLDPVGEENPHICISIVAGGAVIIGSAASAAGYDITETPVGGGSGTSGIDDDYWIFKIDNNGNKIWDKRLGSDQSDWAYGLTVWDDGSYIAAGVSYGDIYGDKSCATNDTGGIWGDWWLIKWGDIYTGINEAQNNLGINSYPNPTNSTINIDITSLREANAEMILENVLGQKIFSKPLQLHRGKNNSAIDVSGFAKGIYVLQIKTRERSYVNKVVKN